MLTLIERPIANELGLTQMQLEVHADTTGMIGEGVEVRQDEEQKVAIITMVVPLDEIIVQQGEPVEVCADGECGA